MAKPKMRQLFTHIEKDQHAKLAALAWYRKVPQWRLLSDVMAQYFISRRNTDGQYMAIGGIKNEARTMAQVQPFTLRMHDEVIHMHEEVLRLATFDEVPLCGVYIEGVRRWLNSVNPREIEVALREFSEYRKINPKPAGRPANTRFAEEDEYDQEP